MTIPYNKILAEQEELNDFEETFSDPLETKRVEEVIREINKKSTEIK